MDQQVVMLVKQLSARGLGYIHVVDYASFGFPPVPSELMSSLRNSVEGTFIRAGGFDQSRAEAELLAGRADLIALGRAFIANPDLIERLKVGAALNVRIPRRSIRQTPRVTRTIRV
jgi:N-ethylmaleimide reductase